MVLDKGKASGICFWVTVFQKAPVTVTNGKGCVSFSSPPPPKKTKVPPPLPRGHIIVLNIIDTFKNGLYSPEYSVAAAKTGVLAFSCGVICLTEERTNFCFLFFQIKITKHAKILRSKG